VAWLLAVLILVATVIVARTFGNTVPASSR
jgi:hypothetical protein